MHIKTKIAAFVLGLGFFLPAQAYILPNIPLPENGFIENKGDHIEWGIKEGETEIIRKSASLESKEKVLQFFVAWMDIYYSGEPSPEDQWEFVKGYFSSNVDRMRSGFIAGPFHLYSGVVMNAVTEGDLQEQDVLELISAIIDISAYEGRTYQADPYLFFQNTLPRLKGLWREDIQAYENLLSRAKEKGASSQITKALERVSVQDLTSISSQRVSNKSSLLGSWKIYEGDVVLAEASFQTQMPDAATRHLESMMVDFAAGREEKYENHILVQSQVMGSSMNHKGFDQADMVKRLDILLDLIKLDRKKSAGDLRHIDAPFEVVMRLQKMWNWDIEGFEALLEKAVALPPSMEGVLHFQKRLYAMFSRALARGEVEFHPDRVAIMVNKLAVKVGASSVAVPAPNPFIEKIRPEIFIQAPANGKRIWGLQTSSGQELVRAEALDTDDEEMIRFLAHWMMKVYMREESQGNHMGYSAHSLRGGSATSHALIDQVRIWQNEKKVSSELIVSYIKASLDLKVTEGLSYFMLRVLQHDQFPRRIDPNVFVPSLGGWATLQLSEEEQNIEVSQGDLLVELFNRLLAVDPDEALRVFTFLRDDAYASAVPRGLPISQLIEKMGQQALARIDAQSAGFSSLLKILEVYHIKPIGCPYFPVLLNRSPKILLSIFEASAEREGLHNFGSGGLSTLNLLSYALPSQADQNRINKLRPIFLDRVLGITQNHPQRGVRDMSAYGLLRNVEGDIKVFKTYRQDQQDEVVQIILNFLQGGNRRFDFSASNNMISFLVKAQEHATLSDPVRADLEVFLNEIFDHYISLLTESVNETGWKDQRLESPLEKIASDLAKQLGREKEFIDQVIRKMVRDDIEEKVIAIWKESNFLLWDWMGTFSEEPESLAFVESFFDIMAEPLAEGMGWMSTTDEGVSRPNRLNVYATGAPTPEKLGVMLRNTWLHEIGHRLDGAMGKRWSYYWGTLNDRTILSSRSARDNLPHVVSGYALSNANEDFAETFKMYMAAPHYFWGQASAMYARYDAVTLFNKFLYFANYFAEDFEGGERVPLYSVADYPKFSIQGYVDILERNAENFITKIRYEGQEYGFSYDESGYVSAVEGFDFEKAGDTFIEPVEGNEDRLRWGFKDESGNIITERFGSLEEKEVLEEMLEALVQFYEGYSGDFRSTSALYQMVQKSHTSVITNNLKQEFLLAFMDVYEAEGQRLSLDLMQFPAFFDVLLSSRNEYSLLPDGHASLNTFIDRLLEQVVEDPAQPKLNREEKILIEGVLTSMQTAQKYRGEALAFNSKAEFIRQIQRLSRALAGEPIDIAEVVRTGDTFRIEDTSTHLIWSLLDSEGQELFQGTASYADNRDDLEKIVFWLDALMQNRETPDPAVKYLQDFTFSIAGSSISLETSQEIYRGIVEVFARREAAFPGDMKIWALNIISRTKAKDPSLETFKKFVDATLLRQGEGRINQLLSAFYTALRKPFVSKAYENSSTPEQQEVLRMAYAQVASALNKPGPEEFGIEVVLKAPADDPAIGTGTEPEPGTETGAVPEPVSGTETETGAEPEATSATSATTETTSTTTVEQNTAPTTTATTPTTTTVTTPTTTTVTTPMTTTVTTPMTTTVTTPMTTTVTTPMTTTATTTPTGPRPGDLPLIPLDPIDPEDLTEDPVISEEAPSAPGIFAPEIHKKQSYLQFLRALETRKSSDQSLEWEALVLSQDQTLTPEEEAELSRLEAELQQYLEKFGEQIDEVFVPAP